MDTLDSKVLDKLASYQEMLVRDSNIVVSCIAQLINELPDDYEERLNDFMNDLKFFSSERSDLNELIGSSCPDKEQH